MTPDEKYAMAKVEWTNAADAVKPFLKKFAKSFPPFGQRPLWAIVSGGSFPLDMVNAPSYIGNEEDVPEFAALLSQYYDSFDALLDAWYQTDKTLPNPFPGHKYPNPLL